MKCPNVDCGFEVEKSFKFCPECGTKMVKPQKPEVVFCRNKLDDGSLCNTEIKISNKFCMGCGIKVDKEMFEKVIKLCSYCKKELVPGFPFCAECGTKVQEKGTFKCKEIVINAPQKCIFFCFFGESVYSFHVCHSFHSSHFFSLLKVWCCVYSFTV